MEPGVAGFIGLLLLATLICALKAKWIAVAAGLGLIVLGLVVGNEPTSATSTVGLVLAVITLSGLISAAAKDSFWWRHLYSAKKRARLGGDDPRSPQAARSLRRQ